ncbi:hypothetical protein WJX77_008334 [Trebouxia sp. C0004]
MASDEPSSRMATPVAEQQPVIYNPDIAKLLLISKAVVLECWPAEEYALQNGTGKKAARSLLGGSLVRLAATTDLVQVHFGTLDTKGHRVLLLQSSRAVSIHDIMEEPWPTDLASSHVFEHVLAQAVNAGSLKSMSIHKVARTLHKIEQAKYWASLKQKHSNPSLHARGKAAVEEQMAACFKSMYKPPAKELAGMVQAGCEEEEPGELSEGRKALRAFLYNNRAARQKAKQTGPAASSAALKRSTSSSPAAQHKESSSNQAQGPKGNVRPQGAGTSVGKCHAAKAAASKAAATYQSAKAVSAGQPSSSSEPALDSSSKRLTAAASAQKASKAQASKQIKHDVRQPSTGLRPQVASHGALWYAQSVKAHVSPGQVSHLAESSSISHEQRSNSAAHASLVPASQACPSSIAEIAPLKGTGNRELPSAARPIQAGIARTDAPVVHTTSQDAAKPDDQDEGIITSATIAKLASRSTAQQAKQGRQAQPGKALTMGQTSIIRPNGVAVSAAVTGKRKSPHKQELSAVSGSTSPAVSMKPSVKMWPGPAQLPSDTPKDPATTSPQTPSPNAASPDQHGPGVRKKIRWDPEAAAVNTAAAHAAHDFYPFPGSKPAATTPATASLDTAARGRTSQPASQAPPGSAAVTSASRAQSGLRQSGQVASQGATHRQDAIHNSTQSIEEGEEGGEEMQSGGFETVLRGDLQWSWGVGAAIQGQFPAAFVSVMPVSAAASAGVATDSSAAISFSTVARLNTATQHHLASTVCAGIMFVQCTEHQPSAGREREASFLGLNHVRSLGSCAYSSIRGLLEHTRLQGCLRESQGALVRSFPGADVLAALAQPKESGRQASTNTGAAPGGQCIAQGSRPTQKTDQHWPLKQPLKANTAGNAGSKHSSGQARQAGSIAQPSSSTTPTEIAQSQTAQTAGFDAAAVSAELIPPRLPAQPHISTADEETPLCSMVLVAGSHLRRWLSIVNMSPEQQQAIDRFHSTHTSGVYAVLLVHVTAAFAQSPSSPFSQPLPPQLQPAACASEAQPQHQAALEEAVADGADVVMADAPLHQETAADQSAMRRESTKQGSKLDDANSHGSNVSVHVTALHLGSTASKDSPPAVGHSSSHTFSEAGDASLAQPQVKPDAVAQQLTEPRGALAAAATAASAQGSAQTTSIPGTDAAHTLRDSTVAMQLRVDRDDRTHVELMLKAPPLAAAACQQPEALSAKDPVKTHGPMANAGLLPMPVQESEAELEAEKSSLQALQLPKSSSAMGKPSSPSKAERQIPDSLPNSQPEADPSRSLAEFAAAVFSSEPSQSETAHRPSAPGQLQSALVPSSRAVALHQPPKPLTEAASPPTRGKGPDPHLDPAAAYMLSGKPAPPQAAVAASVTGAPSPSTKVKQSDAQLKPAAAKPISGLRLQGLPQPAAAASVTKQLDVVQPAAAQPGSAASKGFSAAAGQPMLKAESAEEAAVDSVTTDRSEAVSEAATGAPSKGKQKQKRTDRQLETCVQEAPGPKRAKKAPQTKSAAAEQPAQHQQQQAKPRSESQGRVTGRVKHPVPQPKRPARQSHIDLPACTLDSIFRSIRKLHLLGSGDRGNEQLSKAHMSLLTSLPPLVQLRVLSSYAAKAMPHGNVVKFFRKTVEVLGQRSYETKWLSWHEPTPYKLCKAAADLCGQLGDCGMLPEGAVPTVTPQLLPVELQVPFVLCLGGYTGSMPLADFALDLLQALLSQVVLMLHQFCSTPDDRQTAQANLELAGGSLSKVVSSVVAPASEKSPSHDSQAQQAQHAPKTWVNPPAVPPADGIPLSIRHVASAVFEGLVRINHLKDKNFDKLSYNFLQKQPRLWQLRIISQFAQYYKGGANSSAVLTSICKQNRDQMYREDYTWLTQHQKRAAGRSPELCSSAQALLDDACKADVVLKRCIEPAVLAVLPLGLHCIAVCYAISTAGTDTRIHSNGSAETFVAYAWDLIHECDPKADPRDGVQLSSRPRSQSVVRAASQPPGNGSLDEEATRGRSAVPAAAADQPSDAVQGPLGPSDPHRHHPSIEFNAPPTRHIQPARSPHQAQSHGPHFASPPRHCCYFFCVEGCRTKNCPFYHGTHQEYVAYTAKTGLVPYGLKFVSNVGKDKWIIDQAVDALNKLMLTKQLPRGSFNEHDLRPLAFLEDPNGDHSKLQLQTVQALAEHGHSNYPAQLLQSMCCEVQSEQGGYPLMLHPGVAKPYASRGVASVPELPFSRAMDEAPFASPPIFIAPPAFTPSPPGPAPLPLPFSQEPVPSEDPVERDIPFPLLQYEEELLAGLLQLQRQQGPVESVDQLLLMQPNCAMPADIAAHFPGRDMRGRVLDLLQSRPWLFTVTPHGEISVTRLAREGLVYKRDVITYVYTAHTQDGVPLVTVAELAERVQQPPGITQFMLECNGLAELLGSPLFGEDVTVHHNGPYGPYVVLKRSGL